MTIGDKKMWSSETLLSEEYPQDNLGYLENYAEEIDEIFSNARINLRQLCKNEDAILKASKLYIAKKKGIPLTIHELVSKNTSIHEIQKCYHRIQIINIRIQALDQKPRVGIEEIIRHFLIKMNRSKLLEHVFEFIHETKINLASLTPNDEYLSATGVLFLFLRKRFQYNIPQFAQESGLTKKYISKAINQIKQQI